MRCQLERIKICSLVFWVGNIMDKAIDHRQKDKEFQA